MPFTEVFQKFLMYMGISSFTFYCIVVGCSIVFLLSLREFTIWFLKINKIMKKLDAVEQELRALRNASTPNTFNLQSPKASSDISYEKKDVEFIENKKIEFHIR